jgi:ectoine hydroxylase-related dioxygenase (phytanoyl-CoA dioxygenase family)
MHTPAIQRFFRNTGYYRVPGVLEKPAIRGLNEMLDREFDRPSPKHKTITAAGGSAVKLYGILQRPVIGEALVSELRASEPLQDAAEALLGPNVALTLNRHNHATNNLAGDQTVRMHRDVLQWSRNIVSAIVFLDPARAETGATVLVPGSHLEPFVGVSQPDGGGTWMDEHAEFAHLADQAMAIEVDAGDALLFDGTLFHTAGYNRTSERRRSLALGFKALDELVPPQPATELVLYGEHLYRGNDV